MSKLTFHRILFILSSAVVMSIAEHLVFPKGIDFWVGFFCFMEGLIFSITWDVIFCKRTELKDKYNG